MAEYPFAVAKFSGMPINDVVGGVLTTSTNANGPKSWQASMVTNGIAAVAEEGELEMVLPEGRRAHGRAVRTMHEVRTDSTGVVTDLLFRGSGPLYGL